MTQLGRRNDVDPLVSYAFVVEIDSAVVAHFAGVDGLSYEVEMIEYRDSTKPSNPLFRQGRRKPARVTLKHGVGTAGSNILMDWIRECENGSVKPRNVNITIGGYGPNGLNEASGPKTWQLLRCYPTKWSLGSLDGNSSSNLIESLEVVVEEMIRS